MLIGAVSESATAVVAEPAAVENVTGTSLGCASTGPPPVTAVGGAGNGAGYGAGASGDASGLASVVARASIPASGCLLDELEPRAMHDRTPSTPNTTLRIGRDGTRKPPTL